jgi:hypothetical protein
MDLTDYLVDSLLVLLVLRQVRESRWDAKATALPLVVVAVVAHTYLTTIPTGGADLLLIVGLTVIGTAFGLISALATRLRRDGAGAVLVKAGWLAAGVWVLSMGSRFAFAVWASHGGGPALYRFTLSHHLDITVWTAALVLMALAEVVTRTLVLYARSRQLPAAQAVVEPEPAAA